MSERLTSELKTKNEMKPCPFCGSTNIEEGEALIIRNDRKLIQQAAEYLESQQSTSKSDYDLLMEFAVMVGGDQ